MKWKIRQEEPSEEAAITDVVACAFAGKPYADDSDQHLVTGLRDAGALVLSLVAVTGKSVIGQVALSPAKVGEGRYLCLGPVAVLPEHQGCGIGSALIEHALGVAQVYGRDGVVLMGNPAYYSRFGFQKFADVTYAGDGAEYVQVLPFGPPPEGEVQFHPVFEP